MMNNTGAPQGRNRNVLYGLVGIGLPLLLIGMGCSESDQKVTSRPLAQPSTAPAPPQARPSLDPKTDYLARLAKASARLEAPAPVAMTGQDPKAEIENALGTIEEWAQLYVEGGKLKLGNAEEADRKRLRALLEKAQPKLFARGRTLQAGVWKQVGWDMEIDVFPSGPGNSRLLFRGPQFLLRKNMTAFLEGALPTIAYLRYRRISFQPYQGGEITYFDYDPPADGQVATLGTYRWDPVKP